MLIVFTFSIFVQNSYGIVSDSDEPLIVFENVKVGKNPVPNVPFELTVTLKSPAYNSNMFVFLRVPSDISVLSDAVVEINPRTFGEKTATFTLLAAQAGSFSVDIVASANRPPEVATFNFDLSVGTPKSLVITKIDVPANVYQGQSFNVALTLKNTGIIEDENVITTLSLPTGLQLRENYNSESVKLAPFEEKTFRWSLKAETVGSFPLIIDYSSRNSGQNSFDYFLNVGKRLIADIFPSDILVAGSNVTIANVATGSKQVPIIIKLKNVGTQDLYDIITEIHLETPFSKIYSKEVTISKNTETNEQLNDLIHIPFLAVDDSTDAAFNVDIEESLGPAFYTNIFEIIFSDGGQTFTRFFDLPINIVSSNYKVRTITIAPSPSYPGDLQTRIDLKLANVGTTVNGVDVNLILPEGFKPSWGESDYASINILETSEDSEISFFIDIDNKVKEGVYPFTLLITDSFGSKSEVNFDFIVSSRAIFKVINIDDSEMFPGASAIPFKITLQNVGNSAAESMTTKLLGGNTIPGVRSAQITAVGDIEDIGRVLPDQSFTTTFLVNLDPITETGELTTTVELSWSQNDGASYFVESIQVNYFVPEGPSYLLYYGGISITYVIIILLLILGTVVFYVFRNKKIKTIQALS